MRIISQNTLKVEDTLFSVLYQSRKPQPGFLLVGVLIQHHLEQPFGAGMVTLSRSLHRLLQKGFDMDP